MKANKEPGNGGGDPPNRSRKEVIMKRVLIHSIILACVGLVPAYAAGQTLIAGELPEGLTAADLAGILAAHEAAIDEGHQPLFASGHLADLPGASATQQAYLKASNTDLGDTFGNAVAVSGHTVLVGAPGEASASTDVDGDQGDNDASSAGAVYVFVREGAGWSQQAYLKAPNAESGDAFGRSVALDGDTAVIGATGEDSSATGVDGDLSDNSVPQAGAAYVFVRHGTTWSLEAYLKASNPDANDWFGHQAAISSDTIVVGAYGERSSATGVDGDQADNSALLAGAAYVFSRVGGSWSQQAYLKASNTDALDLFGVALAVSDDTIVVGAAQEDSAATGVDGDQTDNSVPFSGAAYVFVRSGATWSQQAYLKASNTGMNDIFGMSVTVSGDTVVVGAPGERSSATGIDGDQHDNSASGSGAAYVFVRHGTSWSQQAYIKASNTEFNDVFGRPVALSGDTLAIGALGEDSSATAASGEQQDNGARSSGAAYAFRRSGSTWTQVAYLKASNTSGKDIFSASVAVSDDTVVLGAPDEDSLATGVNGDQDDDSPRDAGAAYIHDLGAWSDLGAALAGTSGDPVLVGTGTLADGSSNAIALAYASRGAMCALFVSMSSTPSSFKGGLLIPLPAIIGPLLMDTDVHGALSLPFTLPPGLSPGTELFFQFAILDPVAIEGVALSNAVKASTP
jgi:hypothetical protein